MAGGNGLVGVSDHAGWAILVTATAAGVFVDRRRVALVDDDLPRLPHHHEAQGLPLTEALALVERVRTSAERHAEVALELVARTAPVHIVGIALRQCPPLPPTVAERLASYRAQNVADTVMYRQALARAAELRGWTVRWFDPKQVLAAAGAEAQALGKTLGPPWDKDHRVAFAATVVAGR